MLIAIAEFEVAAGDRGRALAALEAEAPLVRTMPGNLGFHPFVDTDGGLKVLHEWTDRAGFDAYLGSAAFAAAGAEIRPLMTAPPRRRVYAAEAVAVA